MKRILENCPAPAKLNLFLHVTGRRADGYHLLQTAFQLIDRCDLLHFELRDDGEIRRVTAIEGLEESADLCVRAAKLLQQTAWGTQGKMRGADIRLDKRLPMGGGLGGGSSDAATTLMALNHLWNTGLGAEELAALGLRLGADVPFFLCGAGAAFAEGVGEKLVPLTISQRWHVVVEPGIAAPTAAVFAAPELTRNTKTVRMSDFSEVPFSFGKNDLQAVAAALYPPVAEAIEWLAMHGSPRMTGSGACVFCTFDEESQADEVLSKVPRKWKAWKARGLARHPLLHVLASRS